MGSRGPSNNSKLGDWLCEAGGFARRPGPVFVEVGIGEASGLPDAPQARGLPRPLGAGLVNRPPRSGLVNNRSAVGYRLTATLD